MNSSTSSDARHDDDSTVTEFLSSLMDYTPTIPDELVEHYLARSGFHCPDLRLTRLVAVAAQKFISEVASDALQYVNCIAKQDKQRQSRIRDKRLVLTMEDLSKALREIFLPDDPMPLHLIGLSPVQYSVNLKHQEYFADSPTTGTILHPERNELCPGWSGLRRLPRDLNYKITRLVAVAAQKFISQVASDALQHCKARQAAPVKDKSKQPKDKRLVLTMEDLSKALCEIFLPDDPTPLHLIGLSPVEYGVNLKHQEYFADSPTTGTDPSSREE